MFLFWVLFPFVTHWLFTLFLLCICICSLLLRDSSLFVIPALRVLNSVSDLFPLWVVIWQQVVSLWLQIIQFTKPSSQLAVECWTITITLWGVVPRRHNNIGCIQSRLNWSSPVSYPVPIALAVTVAHNLGTIVVLLQFSKLNNRIKKCGGCHIEFRSSLGPLLRRFSNQAFWAWSIQRQM